MRTVDRAHLWPILSSALRCIWLSLSSDITYQRRTCPPPFPSPSRTRFLSYPFMVLLKPNQNSKKYGIKI